MDCQVKIEREDPKFDSITNQFEDGLSGLYSGPMTYEASDAALLNNNMDFIIKQEFIASEEAITNCHNLGIFNSPIHPEQHDFTELVDIKYAPQDVKSEELKFDLSEDQEEFDSADFVKIQYDSLVQEGHSILSNSFNKSGMIENNDMGLTNRNGLNCNICWQRCSSAQDLNFHQYTHTFDTRYTCLICCKTYATKQVLFRHMFQHINNINSNIEPFKSIDVMKSSHPKAYERNSAKDNISYICDICNKSFAKKKYRDRHRLIHFDEKPYKCKICDKSFNSDSNLITHTKIHSDEKPFKCDICGKVFRRRSHLQRHNRVHTGEKSYECEICHRRFQDSSILRNHRSVHTDDRPFECDVCHKFFKSVQYLKTHKLIHSGEKSNVCDICHKGFSNLSNLLVHKKRHAGGTPYECHVCQKSFRQLSHLTRHNIADTCEKPYKCDICHKLFPVNDKLKQHMLVHTGEKPYECDVCQKMFTQSIDVKLHKQLAHSEERPFECDVCQKRFSLSGNLRVHKRVHTGEKPYECDVCHQRFLLKGNYNLHKRMHVDQASNGFLDIIECPSTSDNIPYEF